MIKYIFIAIIVLILLKELYDTYYKPKKNKVKIILPETQKVDTNVGYKNTSEYIFNNINSISPIISDIKYTQMVDNSKQDVKQPIIQEIKLEKDTVWSKVVVDNKSEYPYLFFLKINIPSLNDFQNWKKIAPMLDFDPNTGELIIPAKDEGTALAIANLITANFNGSLSFTDIINKNLLAVSIKSAQTHELVRTKLKDQIKNNTDMKSIAESFPTFSRDLATRSESKVQVKEKMQQSVSEINAYDGGDYSYL